MKRILVINPGSTSTKIAVYDDSVCILNKKIDHSKEELAAFDTIAAQLPMRRALVLKTLEEAGIAASSLGAVAARGGMLPPVDSGAYRVGEDMIWYLTHSPQSEHASNLAAVIAYEIAQKAGIGAYVYDAVSVDELEPIARISGLPEIERKSWGHYLNMRAAAIRYAGEIGRPYGSLNLIVAHLGGGSTISLHKKGRIIDVISDNEGPFSAERSGGLPLFQVAQMATSGQYDYKGLIKRFRNQGGLAAYFGVNDLRVVEALVERGDERAALIYEAMAYQTAKHIASLSAVTSGQVDAVILTGGMAHAQGFTGHIARRVGFLAPVTVYPGEKEMEALALGTLRVLSGEEEAKTFCLDNKN